MVSGVSQQRHYLDTEVRPVVAGVAFFEQHPITASAERKQFYAGADNPRFPFGPVERQGCRRAAIRLDAAFPTLASPQIGFSWCDAKKQ